MLLYYDNLFPCLGKVTATDESADASADNHGIIKGLLIV